MIIGYSGTHGIYQVLKKDGSTKLVKNPKEVHHVQEELKNEENSPIFSQKDQTLEPPSQAIEREPNRPQNSRKTPEQFEQLYGKRKSHRTPAPSLNKREGNINENPNESGLKKAISKLSDLCGNFETCEKVPDKANRAIEYYAHKAQIGAIGVDEDHPTEQQVKEGP